MKYVFEQKRVQSGFAGVKAPRDVAEILHKEGYKTIYYSDLTLPNKIISNIYSILLALKMLFVIKKSDRCFLQWPLYTKSTLLLYSVLRFKRARIVILIHDLNSIRYDAIQYIEKKYFGFADLVIVHTLAMYNYLNEIGIDKDKMRILTSFDYLLEEAREPKRQLSNDVVYAGNLEKSQFLLKIMESNLKVSLFCYGKETYRLSGNLIYKGFFNSDNVSNVEGSWGLVWDGDDVDSCKGVFGKYLKINSPHKLSLYIVSLLPIIIWEESALAGYVVEKELGFTIKRIDEIPSLLSKVSSNDYSRFLENVRRERNDLINGIHLKRCLD